MRDKRSHPWSITVISRLRPILIAIAVVVGVYVILPILGAASGISLAAGVAIIRRGAAFYGNQGFQEYLVNFEGFCGELTLLTASGIVALTVWSRATRQSFVGESRRSCDV